MSVAQRLDAMADLVRAWEARLEREGLRAIQNGEGVPMPEPGRHDIPASERGYLRPRVAGTHHGATGKSRFGEYSPSDAPLPVYERATESIWGLTAAADKLLAAVWRFKFRSRKDRRICKLLADGLSWRDVARRARCSKRRVARVSRQVQAWTDPDGSDS